MTSISIDWAASGFNCNYTTNTLKMPDVFVRVTVSCGSIVRYGRPVCFTMIGKTLSQYAILEGLGRGGLGRVYKAEDAKLRRTLR